MTKRYAGIIKNDIVNGEGICVSFWTQGCPHRCQGCQNPETWNPAGGHPLPADYKEIIASALVENDVERNLSILGGEPLSPENKKIVRDLLYFIRPRFPHIIIYLWTGYTLEYLQSHIDGYIQDILDCVDILIDGPYVQEERDLTLRLRGSRNQRIWEKHDKKFEIIS